MRSIALKLFVILTAIASSKTLCNVQVTNSDLDTYTTTALELYALDHNLPLESHLLQVANLVFGRTEPGYVLFTKKLMRYACKNALSMIDSPIKFYSHVLGEFNRYINCKAEIRILSNFNPKRDPTKQPNAATQGFPKSFTILNVFITLSIITAILLLFDNYANLHEKVVNFHKQLLTYQEEVVLMRRRQTQTQSQTYLDTHTPAIIATVRSLKDVSQRSGLSSLFQ